MEVTVSHPANPGVTRERRAGSRALAELDEGAAHALGIYTRRYGQVSASALLLADVLVGEFPAAPQRVEFR